MREKIIIVDYGMGNINSIKNMLRYLGYSGILSNDRSEILSSDKIILPGVGNYSLAMENIDKMGLKPVLEQAVMAEKKPILGICLGMQLLLSYSEEGDCKGLDFISGSVKKFKLTDEFKVPHMGWDYIKIQNNSPLISNLYEDPRFYFVHSYYAICDERKNCIAKTDYGVLFDSVIGKDHIFGVQFHPEKSHKFGMRLLKNFLEMET